MMKFQKKLWIGLIALAFLSPLGIILPQKFNASEAWGEWDVRVLKEMLGYVPEGLKRYVDLWKAPVPDYNFAGEGATMGQQIISYVISGLMGIAVVALIVYAISRFVVKHEK